MKRDDLATYKGQRVRIRRWPEGSKRAVVEYVQPDGSELVPRALPVGVPKSKIVAD